MQLGQLLEALACRPQGGRQQGAPLLALDSGRAEGLWGPRAALPTAPRPGPRERMDLKAPIYFSTGLTEKANHYYKLFIPWTNQKIRKTFVQRNMFEFKHIKAFDRAFADSPGPMVRPSAGGWASLGRGSSCRGHQEGRRLGGRRGVCCPDSPPPRPEGCLCHPRNAARRPVAPDLPQVGRE